MDVCSQDKALDNIWGPTNESTLDAIRRCYRGLTEKITNPPRRPYTNVELKKEGWSLEPFRLRTSLNANLHCVFWEKSEKDQEKKGVGEKEDGEKEDEGDEEEEEEKTFDRNEIIIIYMHTNTTCCADALEVLPVAASLNACLVAYDLRGHGRSDGDGMAPINTNLEDLEKVVAWSRSKTNKMILWARGAACCVASRYQSLLCPKAESDSQFENPIKYLILDSPFLSVRQMYKDSVDKVREKNYEYVPEQIFSLVAKYFRRGVKQKLGMDPFDISMEPDMELCSIPASFLIAIHDDYIPPHHGTSLAAMYGGPIFARMFEGRHFTPRDEETVTGIVSHIRSRV